MKVFSTYVLDGRVISNPFLYLPVSKKCVSCDNFIEVHLALSISLGNYQLRGGSIQCLVCGTKQISAYNLANHDWKLSR